ncbi:hypothetical protein KOI35_32605 [Actinoplanes bogorensis]|uniref:Uncharacterized protein n=1 Tax=Paractinoplanes bogorensis TaxID=1610840 RepID=A0ABS5YXU6_9ACTN|nr:hypothetical protein [Actinoplanes bogorensis]MBU2668264.1 hypothetical protein [Actinoplanes bogorensis]
MGLGPNAAEKRLKYTEVTVIAHITGRDALDKTTAIETDLADLSGATLDQLCRQAPQDALEPFRRMLINQVDRPRVNIGTGPPGRAD